MAAGCVRERAAPRDSGVESVGLCESVGVRVCACVLSWTGWAGWAGEGSGDGYTFAAGRGGVDDGGALAMIPRAGVRRRGQLDFHSQSSRARLLYIIRHAETISSGPVPICTCII